MKIKDLLVALENSNKLFAQVDENYSKQVLKLKIRNLTEHYTEDEAYIHSVDEMKAEIKLYCGEENIDRVLEFDFNTYEETKSQLEVIHNGIRLRIDFWGIYND